MTTHSTCRLLVLITNRFLHYLAYIVGQISAALSSSPQTFKALYGEEKPDFDDENIVFACFLGKRSIRAMQIAHELGYTK